MNEPERQTPETSQIEIPGAPAIDGLVFRRFHGDTDPGAFAALASQCAPGDSLSEYVEEEATGDLASFDAQPNAIFAELRGELVAYGRAAWYPTYAGQMIYHHTVRVRPDWRGRGIGAALLGYVQAILGEIAIGHTEAREQFFETQAADDADARQLAAQGYRPARRYLRMERSLEEEIPAVDLPAGLEVRSPRPDEQTRVLDGLVEAMRDHWGAGPPPDADHRAFLQAVFCQPELWVVAWDGDEVAGMVLNWIPYAWNERTGRKVGIPDPLGVRRPWRRRGLAQALLARSLALLKEKGMETASLKVDSENPNGAPALFAALGFQPVHEWTVFRKPLRTGGERIG